MRFTKSGKKVVDFDKLGEVDAPDLVPSRSLMRAQRWSLKSRMTAETKSLVR